MLRLSTRLKNKIARRPVKEEPLEKPLEKLNEKSKKRPKSIFKKDECKDLDKLPDYSSIQKEEIDIGSVDIKIEQDANEENTPGVSREITGTSQLEMFEAVKSEVNVKLEPVDTDFSEDFPKNEFSGYEHLLKNITVEHSDGKNETEGNESSEEEEPDDPDDPDVDLNDETDDDDTNDEEDPDDPNYMKNTAEAKKNKFPFYFCSHCDFKCKIKSQLTDHMASHGGNNILRCQFCGDVFRNEQYLEKHCTFVHSELLRDKTLTKLCKFCHRGFKTEQSLFDHIKTHSSDKPYECIRCSKKFMRKGGLNQHLHHHLGFRPFKCNFCHLAFKTKGNKDSHMKRHLGVKEFKCDKCGKDFIRKDQLKKHILCVHYKKCMYRCSICNKSFKGHVLSHLRIHMNEKQFKCDQCGKSFVQSSQLNVHMRTHTGAKPYKCEVCKVSFSHSSAVRVHMRIHTGEKPVKCQLCPAAFSQLPHLKKHMRCVHKSDKPYVCVPCHKFFQTKSELSDHSATKKCKQSTD